MKKLSRILSVSLVLSLLAGIMPVYADTTKGSAFVSQAEAEYNGFITPPDNDDIPEGAIHIQTAQELKAIGGSANAGKYYVLDNDITLDEEWTPITGFRATLDGRGHSINNLFILKNSSIANAGLIGTATANVSIKNLAVNVGESGITGTSLAGALLATANGSVSIDNCYVTGKINGRTSGTSSNDNAVGGLVGSGSVTAKNSYVAADITGFNAGGLVGKGTTISLENCYSEGDVFLPQSSALRYAGGLIGTAANVTIKESYSIGDVTDGQSSNTEAAYLGGLIGYVTTNAAIAGSFSDGNISVNNNLVGSTYNPCAGGLVGNARSSVTIEGSYSRGDISAKSTAYDTSKYAYAGGLVGINSSGTSNGTLTINNCYAVGSVRASHGRGNAVAGGLVGRADRALTTYSYAACNVSAKNTTINSLFRGGLIGYVGSDCATNNSLFDKELMESFQDNSHGTPKETAEMKFQGTYLDTGFDFTTIWDIDPDINDGYPYLKNRSAEGDGEGDIIIIVPNYVLFTGYILRITAEGYSRDLSVSGESTRVSGVDRELIYKAELFSPTGISFGVIEDISFGTGKDITSSFISLPVPKTVSITVLGSENHELSTGFTVSWYIAGDTERLAEGASIAGVRAGMELEYEIVLEGGLASGYETPQRAAITVSETDTQNAVTVSLTPKSLAVINGYVGSGGESVEGASVRVDYGGESEAETATDAAGHFSINAYPGIISVYVTKFGYADYFRMLPLTAEGAELEIEIERAEGLSIALDMNHTLAAFTGETPVTLPVYDTRNISFSIYNDTESTAITNFTVSSASLIVDSGVLSVGDTLIVTAEDLTGNMARAEAQITVADTGNSIELDFKQNGALSATVSSSENSDNMALLFGSSGKHVTTIYADGQSFYSGILAEDTYDVVFIGDSPLFCRFDYLSDLTAAGLEENTDYVLETVNITPGEITVVDGVAIPELNESKLYYTKIASFTANKVETVIGDTIVLRAEYSFKDEYSGEVSNFNIIADIPVGCTLVANSVTLDGVTADPTVGGGKITVSTVKESGIVRFSIIPTVSGEYASTAAISFKYDNQTFSQPIGTAVVNTKSYSINVPSKTSSKNVTITGFAPPKSAIEVFDNDVLVATANANEIGSWNSTFNLVKTYAYSWHDIYAKISTPSTGEIYTDKNEIFYSVSAARLSTVTMINYWHEVQTTVFDFINPPAKPIQYSFNPNSYDNGREFTFIVEFIDGDNVSDVTVITADSSGKETAISTVYEPAKKIWIGTYSYPFTFLQANPPVRVSVEYRENDQLLYSEERDAEIKNEISEYAEAAYQSGAYSVYFNPDDGDSPEVCLYNSDGDGVLITKVSGDSDDNIKETPIYCPFPTGKIRVYTPKNANFDVTPVNVKRGANSNDPPEYTPFYSDTSKLADAHESMANAQKMIYDNSGLPDDEYMSILKDTVMDAGTMLGAPYFDEAVNIKSFSNAFSFLKNIVSYSNSIEDSRKHQQYIINRYNWYIERIKNAECITPENREKLIDYANTLCKETIYGELLYSIGDKISAFTGFFTDITTIAVPGDAGRACDLIFGVPLLAANAEYAIKKTDMRNAEKRFANVTFENLIRKYTSECAIGDFSSDCACSAKCSCGCNAARGRWGIRGSSGGYLMNHLSAIPLIDPSGYVYEAVESNRLSGVTATVYYADDDSGTNSSVWNAGDYSQENPLITDREGCYAWDVPTGWWQVKYKKDGYEAAESEWLPVPPPQTEVNIGMVSNAAPKVTRVDGYEDYIEVTFDRHMDTSSITVSEISLAGFEGDYSVSFIGAEKNPKDEQKLYARIMRVIPSDDNTFTMGDTIGLFISHSVKSYAGVNMNADYSGDVEIELEPKAINHPESITLNYGETKEISVTISPAGTGKKITAVSDAPMLVSVTSEAVSDSNSLAKLNLTGLMAGTAKITLAVDGTQIKKTISVAVALPSKDSTAYTIDVSAKSGGTVSGGGAFLEGAQVILTATPDEGYAFDGWYENGSKLAQTGVLYSFEAVADRTLEARFTKIGGSDGYLDDTPPENGEEKDKTAIINGHEYILEPDGDNGYAVIIKDIESIELNVSIAGLNGKSLAIITDFGTIILSNDVLQKIMALCGDMLILVIKEGSFTVTLIADGKEFSYNGSDNPFVIKLPYTLAAGQTQEEVVATDSSGRIIPYSVYGDGFVSFAATAMGTYDVIYKKADFPDVKGHWAQDYISFDAARGLYVGNEKGEFTPEGSMTRAMFCQIIANLEGVDLTAYTSCRFDDVQPGMWYAPAVEWAAENGIVSGFGDDTFAPGHRVTREQMALMLFNYMDHKGYTPYQSAKSAFADASQISEWAYDAVEAVHAMGIVNGKPGNVFDPQGTATRAETAAVFARFIQKINETLLTISKPNL